MGWNPWYFVLIAIFIILAVIFLVRKFRKQKLGLESSQPIRVSVFADLGRRPESSSRIVNGGFDANMFRNFGPALSTIPGSAEHRVGDSSAEQEIGTGLSNNFSIVSGQSIDEKNGISKNFSIASGKSID